MLQMGNFHLIVERLVSVKQVTPALEENNTKKYGKNASSAFRVYIDSQVVS